MEPQEQLCKCFQIDPYTNSNSKILDVCLNQHCHFKFSRISCLICRQPHQSTCDPNYLISIQDFFYLLEQATNLNSSQMERLKNKDQQLLTTIFSLQNILTREQILDIDLPNIEKMTRIFPYNPQTRNLKLTAKDLFNRTFNQGQQQSHQQHQQQLHQSPSQIRTKSDSRKQKQQQKQQIHQNQQQQQQLQQQQSSYQQVNFEWYNQYCQHPQQQQQPQQPQQQQQYHQQQQQKLQQNYPNPYINYSDNILHTEQQQLNQFNQNNNYREDLEYQLEQQFLECTERKHSPHQDQHQQYHQKYNQQQFQQQQQLEQLEQQEQQDQVDDEQELFIVKNFILKNNDKIKEYPQDLIQMLRNKYKNHRQISQLIYEKQSYTQQEKTQIGYEFFYLQGDGHKYQQIKDKWNLSKKDIDTLYENNKQTFQQYQKLSKPFEYFFPDPIQSYTELFQQKIQQQQQQLQQLQQNQKYQSPFIDHNNSKKLKTELQQQM